MKFFVIWVALNGYGNEAVEFLKEILIEGLNPDQVTFVGVLPATLSACSHSGLVDQGLENV